MERCRRGSPLPGCFGGAERWQAHAGAVSAQSDLVRPDLAVARCSEVVLLGARGAALPPRHGTDLADRQQFLNIVTRRGKRVGPQTSRLSCWSSISSTGSGPAMRSKRQLARRAHRTGSAPSPNATADTDWLCKLIGRSAASPRPRSRPRTARGEQGGMNLPRSPVAGTSASEAFSRTATDSRT